MATYRYKISGLSASTRYRVDTASGSATPATITSKEDGNAVPGAIVRSDTNGAGVEFAATVGTLYVKQVDINGALTGASPVTVTGVLATDQQTPTPIGAVTAAGQSGAVTVDLSKGLVQVLTLTGNVTGWVFSNPPRSGQEVVVAFLQDATGSRTLTGADTTIKLAGGAVTLTTAANKRDVITFRYVGGAYYETARALNV